MTLEDRGGKNPCGDEELCGLCDGFVSSLRAGEMHSGQGTHPSRHELVDDTIHDCLFGLAGVLNEQCHVAILPYVVLQAVVKPQGALEVAHVVAMEPLWREHDVGVLWRAVGEEVEELEFCHGCGIGVGRLKWCSSRS